MSKDQLDGTAFLRRAHGMFKVGIYFSVSARSDWTDNDVTDWPTVLLILPRAGISLVILLLYGTTVYGSMSDAIGVRTSIYFIVSSGALSTYGIAIIIA